jgi:hypothetical protein
MHNQFKHLLCRYIYKLKELFNLWIEIYPKIVSTPLYFMRYMKAFWKFNKGHFMTHMQVFWCTQCRFTLYLWIICSWKVPIILYYVINLEIFYYYSKLNYIKYSHLFILFTIKFLNIMCIWLNSKTSIIH